MERSIFRKGLITTDPVVATGYTWFKLQSGQDECIIIRLDPEWQKRDLVFLCVGQTVEVMGTCNPNHNSVTADRIVIVDYPAERLQRKDEKTYGYETL